VALVVLCLAGVGLALLWRTWQSSSSAHADAADLDPRLSFPTPYRNVRPEVRSVGDAACTECHAAIALTYRQHPMGQSLVPVAARQPLERCDRAANNPFTSLGLEFSCETPAGRMVQRAVRRDGTGRPAAELVYEIGYVLGSGTRGRAYLWQRDGYVFQSPLSWYTQKHGWDLSAGFEAFYPQERGVADLCLFCHANQAEAVEASRNHYRSATWHGDAIGCERCHGPGELHVAARREAVAPAGDLDDTIVNPARLEPALREAVCQQCHLQGKARVLPRGRETFDFRPGLPLERFWSIFEAPADAADARKAVGQVEEMVGSRCYTGSNGRLGCISCHDPHRLPEPAQRVAYYRDRCLQCHQVESCKLPPATRRSRQAEDDCTACHMPRRTTADIAHTALTDHQIIRSPDSVGPAHTRSSPAVRGSSLVSFFPTPAGVAGEESERDLGVALCQAGRQPGANREIAMHVGLPLLEKALARAPTDPTAWEAKGMALSFQGKVDEALGALENALQQSPGREVSLSLAYQLAERLGQRDRALDYCRRLVRVNPWLWEYRYPLARLLAEKGDWKEASDESEAAVRQNPFHEATRILFLTALLRGGQKERAAKELETLLRLNPKEEQLLRDWFARESQVR
jgi:predicted CXXCH cytochrome family protein